MKHSASKDGADNESSISLSDLFDDTSADLSFVSSDNFRYYLHSKYVAANAEGLQSIAPSQGEVRLEERSEVLTVLFQFIRPNTKNRSRPPSLSELNAELFFEVVEAAERYSVVWAINSCHPHMLTMVKQYPIQALNYAVKGDHPDLAELAAQDALPETMSAIIAGLTYPGLLVVWLEYYAHWQQLAKLGQDGMCYRLELSPCPVVNRLGMEYCRMVSKDPRKVEQPHEYVQRSLASCGSSKCSSSACWCRVPWGTAAIDKEITQKRKDIPSFNTLWKNKQQGAA